MDTFEKIKTASIILMLVLVTVVHHIPIAGFFGAHIFHRELFFFPVVLAGIWFGLKAALATSVAASIVYAHFFTHMKTSIYDPHQGNNAKIIIEPGINNQGF